MKGTPTLSNLSSIDWLGPYETHIVPRFKHGLVNTVAGWFGVRNTVEVKVPRAFSALLQSQLRGSGIYVGEENLPKDTKEISYPITIRGDVSVNFEPFTEPTNTPANQDENPEGSTHKIARDREAAWDIQDKHEGKPHGWVQWKGTKVCMDVHCKCGYSSHLDAEFAYTVKCPKCGTSYMCNGHIELIELQEEPENVLVAEGNDDEDEDEDIGDTKFI